MSASNAEKLKEFDFPDENLIGVANFMKIVSDGFAVFNSREPALDDSPLSAPYGTHPPLQHSALECLEDMIQNMEVDGGSGFKEAILCNIAALRGIYVRLDVESLHVDQFNVNPLELFFTKIYSKMGNRSSTPLTIKNCFLSCLLENQYLFEHMEFKNDEHINELIVVPFFAIARDLTDWGGYILHQLKDILPPEIFQQYAQNSEGSRCKPNRAFVEELQSLEVVLNNHFRGSFKYENDVVKKLLRQTNHISLDNIVKTMFFKLMLRVQLQQKYPEKYYERGFSSRLVGQSYNSGN